MRRGTAATFGAADGHLSVRWRPEFHVNPQLTLSVHGRGPRDPALRVDEAGAIWRTSLTPDGPATLRLSAARGPTGPGAAGLDGAGPADGRQDDGAPNYGRPAAPSLGRTITATAWGPGAAWALAAMPDLLGAQDEPGAFRPEHPRLRDLVVRCRGLRVSRTGRVLEALVPAVLEQKVVGGEARRAWRLLLTWHGLPAPGPAPAGMRVPPPAPVWAAVPSWDWHRAGVEAVRAATIVAAARVSSRLEQITALSGPEADRRLRSLPGIGPWTAAEVRQRACGDADAVSVGDYHIPGLVGWALAGRPVDDAGMLELLAPYAGQRYRVTRLIELSGAGPPRRGPRMSIRDYRSI
ncbi:MAG TPA: DNA-3-methyladenine glycosylase 2 family protein [Streptosporangiaceae bacterium]|jgi:3-methyladenine DNA glycosylase/8-oxoguanine DNA glycosylase